MTANAWLQLLLYLAVLLAVAKPLGGYMARVYQGRRAAWTVFWRGRSAGSIAWPAWITNAK